MDASDLSIVRRILLKHSKRVGKCRLWTAGKTTAGYGTLHFRGKLLYAHRLAAEIAYGAIPPRMYVCHRCDVPSCIYWRHLFIGTPSDNARDCIAKGRRINRGRKGEAHHQAKLTEVDVLAIRREFSDSPGITKAELGRRYGVTQENIAYIVTRRTWTHIP